MIVSELIKELKKMPGDLKIWYSAAYDSDVVQRIEKVQGTEVFGADNDEEIVHLIYW